MSAFNHYLNNKHLFLYNISLFVEISHKKYGRILSGPPQHGPDNEAPNITCTTVYPCRQSLVLMCTNMFGITELLNYTFNRVTRSFFGTNELHDNPDAFLPTPDIIERHGYPVSTHRIRTNDGYNLQVHRIPHGRNEANKARTRPVVFLQHGLHGSSADWILSGPGKGLGFLLADNGYDVWMGNSRGNRYSKNHVSLEPESEDFWNFSWDQMAEYDLPAVIDYIQIITQQLSLIYIGHSMGTTMFFAFMSTHPDYQRKVKLMVALAPVAYLSHMSGPLRDLAKVIHQYPMLMSLFGKRKFLPDGKVLTSMVQNFWKQGPIYNAICAIILNAVPGYCKEHIEEEIKPAILSHALAGTSTKTVSHYIQHINLERFSKFNLGEKKNRQVYKQTSPPLYPLEQVSVPVAAFYSVNDYFVSSTDVNILLDKLPSVVERYKVESPCFNHFDFIFASDARNLIYRDVIHVIHDFCPTY